MLPLLQGSPMLPSAFRYLTLRSIGAPAVLLNLAMQGVFRGFKDTKTPLYATGMYYKPSCGIMLVLIIYVLEIGWIPFLNKEQKFYDGSYNIICASFYID